MLALESPAEQMFPTENIPMTSKCQAHIFEGAQAGVVVALIEVRACITCEEPVLRAIRCGAVTDSAQAAPWVNFQACISKESA
jgi:hypothetical protein